MDNSQIIKDKEKLKAYNIALENWEKRKLLDLKTLAIDEVCVNLIINNKVNKPIAAIIFNNQESINIGLFIIPNQFDEINTQEKFTADFESVRNQFDALLLMNNDSSFTNFGFQEFCSNNKNTTMTYYRNSYFDFESFKNVFNSKSIVFMRTAFGSSSNEAMNTIQSAFTIPDFYRNQIITIKDSIICLTYGTNLYLNNEINSICKYCLDQIRRGNSLTHNTFEDESLGKNIRISAFINGTNTPE